MKSSKRNRRKKLGKALRILKSAVKVSTKETKKALTYLKKTKKRVSLLWILIFALILGGITIFSVSNRNTVNPDKKTQEAIKKLSRFIELPKDEKPTVATVSDVEKLKSQPFFKDARNGDMIFIYPKAKKAILYRPFSNMIIEVASIKLEGVPEESEGLEKADVFKTARVAIYSQGNFELTKAMELKVKQNFPNIVVVDRGSTVRKDYQKNLVIDVTGKNQEIARKISRSINADLVSLPEGEIVPAADILVIAAKY